MSIATITTTTSVPELLRAYERNAGDDAGIRAAATSHLEQLLTITPGALRAFWCMPGDADGDPVEFSIDVADNVRPETIDRVLCNVVPYIDEASPITLGLGQDYDPQALASDFDPHYFLSHCLRVCFDSLNGYALRAIPFEIDPEDGPSVPIGVLELEHAIIGRGIKALRTMHRA